MMGSTCTKPQKKLYSAYDPDQKIWLFTGRNSKTKEECIKAIGELVVKVLTVKGSLDWKIIVKKFKK